jgi:hypothetical protein
MKCYFNQNIYPVPASQYLTIEVNPLEEPLEIEFYNSFGRMVKSLELPAGTNQIQLNISDLSAGFYHLVFRSDDLMESRKVIVSD